MKKLLVLLPLFSVIAFVLQYCTSSQAETVSYKKYLAHKTVVACMPGAPGDEEWKEDPGAIPALRGWGHYQWKITAANDSASYYFNQGISMYYAFHMIEAKGSFAKATTFDPACAMAYWGLALASGPNINYPDIDSTASTTSLLAIGNANRFAAQTSEKEQALIRAIAFRYSRDNSISREKLNADYAAAMKAAYEKHLSDGDIATLYADALLVEHPWDLYEQDGSPKTWTPPIVTVLEHILSQHRNHPGANHYYIHAVEASRQPGKALASANRLDTMMPDVSHMVHMPSHIYIRTGNYRKGINVNTSAVNGFYKYANEYKAVEELAPLYLSHNQHMQVACSMMQGWKAFSEVTAEKTRDGLPAEMFAEPSAFGNYLQYMHAMPLLVKVRFGQWKALLDEPTVNEKMDYEYALQLFAKGMAATYTGKATALDYLGRLQEKMKTPILHEKYASFANSAFAALQVAEQLLLGSIAIRANKLDEAVEHFQTATTLEDAMMYGEPKDWLLPARHFLGDALLKAKRYTEAEAVYNKDLEINPDNGWALYGLMQALQAQKKDKAATEARTASKKAFEGTDITLAGSIIQ